MHSGVACRAQRDQVFLGVASRMAAELPVVHLKIRHRATGLTPPTRRDAEPAGADFRTTRDPAAREQLWGESFQDALPRRFSRKNC